MVSVNRLVAAVSVARQSSLTLELVLAAVAGLIWAHDAVLLLGLGS
jgi:hypothetical protein